MGGALVYLYPGKKFIVENHQGTSGDVIPAFLRSGSACGRSAAQHLGGHVCVRVCVCVCVCVWPPPTKFHAVD